MSAILGINTLGVSKTYMLGRCAICKTVSALKGSEILWDIHYVTKSMRFNTISSLNRMPELYLTLLDPSNTVTRFVLVLSLAKKTNKKCTKYKSSSLCMLCSFLDFTEYGNTQPNISPTNQRHESKEHTVNRNC